MDKEQAIRLVQNNGKAVQIEAAKRRLINFAKYVNPKLDISPFHFVYYQILDKFAHGQIKKLIVSVPPQSGKALKVDTPVLTTNGWKRHADLSVGDYVFGEDGKPKQVLWNSGAYKHQTQIVRFADGFELTAAPEHEWVVYSNNTRFIVETQQIAVMVQKPIIKRFGDKPKIFQIVEIVTDFPKYVNCIQVEGGIYLAGRQLVPTHNSEGSSRILPSYMLGLNPDLKICIGSYSATIARDFNRDVQRIIDKEEYHDIFPATQLNNKNIVTVSSNYLRNSDVFECVGRKGGLRVVGRGGSLTSKTVDISILDDVYKDYAEGNSPVIREAAWKWYTTVVRTRLHNDSQEIIVFTRWHEDDLIGRLEKSGEQIIDVKSWADIENVPKAAWVKINFEAIKTTEPNEIDKRQIGEALWPARHSLEKLIAQKELDAVQFQCLFQGNPSSAEGRLYNAFKTWTDKAEFGEYIRTGCYIDVADTGKDYLCAICYEVRKSANTIYNEKTHRFEPILFALVTDIVFTQESTEITTISVPEMINRNGVQRCYVEANNGGTQFERTISRKVRAQTIAITQHANKESKILTNSAIVNNQIVMPIGWESRFSTFYESVTTYLRDFKANAHDDAPDALSEIAIRELADGNTRPYGAETRGVRVR